LYINLAIYLKAFSSLKYYIKMTAHTQKYKYRNRRLISKIKENNIPLSMDEKNKIITINCPIIFRNNEEPYILTMRSLKDDNYHIPGGKKEIYDINDIQTASREMSEETGINIQVLRKFKDYIIEIERKIPILYPLSDEKYITKKEKRLFKTWIAEYLNELPDKPTDVNYDEFYWLSILECHVQPRISKLVIKICDDLCNYVEGDYVNIERLFR